MANLQDIAMKEISVDLTTETPEFTFSSLGIPGPQGNPLRYEDLTEEQKDDLRVPLQNSMAAELAKANAYIQLAVDSSQTAQTASQEASDKALEASQSAREAANSVVEATQKLTDIQGEVTKAQQAVTDAQQAATNAAAEVPKANAEVIKAQAQAALAESAAKRAETIATEVRDGIIKHIAKPASGAAITVAVPNGFSIIDVDLTEPSSTITLDPSGMTADIAQVSLVLHQGTGANKVDTWGGTIKWSGQATPVLSVLKDRVDIVTFLTTDKGLNWYGFFNGGNF